MSKIPLVVLVGPTASGKTDLSIKIAKKMNGEIVSADSMQVYQGMDIGTAKPTLDERGGVLHYMIDIVQPHVNYNLSMYINEAKKCIESIHKKGKLPILAGGTFLYVDTLVYNISLSNDSTDSKYKNQLIHMLHTEGAQKLHDLLKSIDPKTAQRLHINDHKRIIRALEIYNATGMTQSEHNLRSNSAETPYNFIKIALGVDREILYDRINHRVDKMMDSGLVEEVQNLLCMGVKESDTSMQGIGYKEISKYLSGAYSKEDAVSLLKQSTRRYAKRQLTWLRRYDDALWIDMTDQNNITKNEDISSKAIEKLFYL